MVIGFTSLFILCTVLLLLTNTRTRPKAPHIPPTEIRVTSEVEQILPASTHQSMTIVLPLIIWYSSPPLSTETPVLTETPVINLEEPILPTQITKGETVIIEEGCANGCIDHKEGCDIKGNISYTTGEKIYHVPGGEFYDKCVVDPNYGERWFCTEAEAMANGWRKSKR